MNGLQVKLEKALSLLGNVATGADLERIDVQIGALRQLIREVMSGAVPAKAESDDEGVKRSISRIQSNTKSGA
ncbi:MAG: hypothetical protein EBZ48_11540 [Proteobacteria bacterium]|nr:hypothetical protein [Pseudomonadota bacterium]